MECRQLKSLDVFVLDALHHLDHGLYQFIRVLVGGTTYIDP